VEVGGSEMECAKDRGCLDDMLVEVGGSEMECAKDRGCLDRAGRYESLQRIGRLLRCKQDVERM